MEKIYLEKGETLHNEPNKIVCVTGEYEPSEFVLVGELNNPIYEPDFPLYQYPAHYIKYGDYLNENELQS
jgi:hypothetical protein